jgi:hypothetical protein
MDGYMAGWLRSPDPLRVRALTIYKDTLEKNKKRRE